ncbi:ABC_transporter family protein [Hexamita inflata]|uniref:ABC transporter family protein n=1 Tax=Hexamita inflata TaxID=28002 RepID=A0AA86UH49_9EUKA|nr:ABC transporter family protein [Hexamita inflata]
MQTLSSIIYYQYLVTTFYSWQLIDYYELILQAFYNTQYRFYLLKYWQTSNIAYFHLFVTKSTIPFQTTDTYNLQRLIFLDEPTTGLDPVTKRAVWKTIEEAKNNKIIILTTHSMEEADALSQYIGIMAAGQMRAIGTRQRLKSRFGSGYRLQIIHSVNSADEIDDLVFMAAPNIRIDRREPVPADKELVRSFYIIPPGDPISFVYEACQEQREQGLIKEFGLEFTSLEEVFLTIAQMVEPPDEAEKGLLAL